MLTPPAIGGDGLLMADLLPTCMERCKFVMDQTNKGPHAIQMRGLVNMAYWFAGDYER